MKFSQAKLLRYGEKLMEWVSKSTCEGVNRYYDYSVESQWNRNNTAWFSNFRRAWDFTGIE